MAATRSPKWFRKLARFVIKNLPKPREEREILRELDDSSEDPAAPENESPDSDGDERPWPSFSTAFKIVIAIHLLVIGGFYVVGAVKSMRGPQYAGIPQAKESVRDMDKTWLKDHPASSEPPAKVAQTGAANPKKTAKKDKPAAAPHVVTSGKKESKPVAAKTKPVTTKPAVVAKTELLPAPIVSQPESDNPPWMEKAKAMLARPLPPRIPVGSPVEMKLETRRAVPVVNEAPVVATPSAPDEVSLFGGEYTLVSGDTLYAVSRKAHVSYQEIAVANGIKDPRQLQVGQKLKIPSGKVTSL